MTIEEAIIELKQEPCGTEIMEFPETFEQFAKEYGFKDSDEVYTNGSDLIPIFRVKQWLEHEMSAEQYRQRMIQAFHNTDCDELIAICVLPTEKEFKHLEWLLKNHYKDKHIRKKENI